MKKIVQKETTVCDFCDNDESVYGRCLGCGKHVCEAHGVRYSLSGFENSRSYEDGVYCKECDAKLDDPLHRAWVELRKFHEQYRSIHQQWYHRLKEKQEDV